MGEQQMRRSRLVTVPLAAALVIGAVAPALGSADARRQPAAAAHPATRGAHKQYLLTVPGGRKGDQLGTSVAIGKGLVAVGAPYRTVHGHKHQGAVYVFKKPASGWGHATVTAVLTIAAGKANDFFGSSVAIAGNTIAVGTPLITVGTNLDEGAVYLFTKPAGGWSKAHHPTGRLFPTDRTANDLFGSSLAGTANTFVVGAPGHVVGQHSRQGAAYVFVRPRGGWQRHTRQTAELTASDGLAGNGLGQSVAISGRTIAAGAPYVHLGSHASQGAAYVFREPRSGWRTATDVARLTVRHGATKDYFGQAVAVSGSTVVASSTYRKIGTRKRQGAAYVYTPSASGWHNETQNATLTVQPGVAGAYFGGGLAFSGTRIIGTGYGLASIFTRPAGGWRGSRHQQVQLAGQTSADRIGPAIAVFGSTIVAGVPGHSEGHRVAEGAAYVFVR
jgi:hypothetical protein